MSHEDLAKRLAVPIKLDAFPDGEKGKPRINVVIETARGGRNKLAYDERLGIFRLKKVLPEGMSFPYDFGFVPSTVGDDGDPLDAVVLMDEPGTTGCLVECRLIGVILGEQGKKKRDRCRNDRLIAVALPSHTHGDLKKVSELNRSMLTELEKFFVNYHAEYGEEYRVLGCEGPDSAWKLVKRGNKKWERKIEDGDSA